MELAVIIIGVVVVLVVFTLRKETPRKDMREFYSSDYN